MVPRYQVLYRVSPGSLTSDPAAVEEACLVVLDRALGAASRELRRGRNEYLANVKHHVCFLQLTKTAGRDYRAQAGRKLIEAIRLNPLIVARRKTFTLLCAWTLLRLLPRSLAPAMMTGLLRLHGRMMALVVPELRESLIVARR
jgi:hypothetical protein